MNAVGSTLEDLVNEQHRAAAALSAASCKPDASATESKLSTKVLVMLPVFRFLQLLCENHNRDLQNFLRAQSNKNSYNLVSETLMFLDCICGSTTGELGLLGLYINEHNVCLINQTLETLTEYCQVKKKQTNKSLNFFSIFEIDLIFRVRVMRIKTALPRTSRTVWTLSRRCC